MEEKIKLLQNGGYCNCKSSCNSEQTPRVHVPKDIDYAIIMFGKTSNTDKIVYWANSKDIKSVLDAADEREICLGSNTMILRSVKDTLSGPYNVVTLRKTGQENGKELEKYFHFVSELSNDEIHEKNDYKSLRKKTVEEPHNLLRMPLYDDTGKELEMNEFINQFNERVIQKNNKDNTKKDNGYYASLICRTVSSIAKTNCKQIEDYVDVLIDGKGHEFAFDEDELFKKQFGMEWKNNIRITDAENNTADLKTFASFYNAILAEDTCVKATLKEKIKPDQDLITRAKNLKADKAKVNNYKNEIISQLQQKLMASYANHPAIEAIYSEQKSIIEKMDLAKKAIDESDDKSLEHFLHQYQLADLKLSKNDDSFSIVRSICDKVGGEGHHKLHQKEDKTKRKVLLTNLDIDNSNHWQMYLEKYRGLVDSVVLFRKHGK